MAQNFDMVEAAPVIRMPISQVGAPGRTDHVNIFIASELNDHEDNLVLRHEQTHVWALHRYRIPKELLEQPLVEAKKVAAWKAATELEIARNIYSEQDERLVKNPFSYLAGGFLKDTIPELPPELLLAEEIYQWLLDNPSKIPEMECTCLLVLGPPDGSQAGSGNESLKGKTPKQVLAEAIEKAKKLELTSAQANVEKTILQIRNRTPSLSAALDHELRVRMEREQTYRRPSRREYDSDIIMRGRISTPRPPLVEIFTDRSGSFSADKTAQAEIVLQRILERYHSSIKSDVWYFGNGRLTAEVLTAGEGGTPYELIYAHLLKSKPKVAIVITDADSVSNEVQKIKGTRVLCIPIGCTATSLSRAIGGTDVSLGEME